MNNYKLVSDEISLSLDVVDKTELIKERESRLVNIIEAIGRIKDSTEWSTLKTLIFDGVLETLEKRLKNESEKLELNPAQIHYLQGQLQHARKYDLDKLLEVSKLELTNLRQKHE